MSKNHRAEVSPFAFTRPLLSSLTCPVPSQILLNLCPQCGTAQWTLLCAEPFPPASLEPAAPALHLPICTEVTSVPLHFLQALCPQSGV